MNDRNNLFGLVLDSLEDQIAVVDRSGAILYVNEAWMAFGCLNGIAPEHDWVGTNYLRVCEASSSCGDEGAADAAHGIAEVLGGEAPDFAHEYPCHSPEELRWFMMRIAPVRGNGGNLFVISHRNITKRKLAEQKAESLSLQDSLTGLANRRHLDRFLSHEWQRGLRYRSPVSLVMLDIDHFKAFNDRFGHLAGDQCLCRVGHALQGFARRPGDLAARYGGEEFALILGETSMAEAHKTAEAIRREIGALDFSDAGIPKVSISAGVASAIPEAGQPETVLVREADKALYYAKQAGRNRVECLQITPVENKTPLQGAAPGETSD